MADWHLVSLVWKGRAPPPIALAQLNKGLYELDYDVPQLLQEGLDSARWRSPLIELEVFLDFLHMQGFPCSGRRTFCYGDEDEWQTHQGAGWMESHSTMHQIFAHLVKESRSRFERILDE